MGKLRNQMVSDLCMRNYSPKTIQSYTWCVYHFVKHFRRSPDLMGEQEIRRSLLFLAEERQASPSLRKLFVAAIFRTSDRARSEFGTDCRLIVKQSRHQYLELDRGGEMFAPLPR